jgi:uncharacterized protein YjbI with pentapeptide repeats
MNFAEFKRVLTTFADNPADLDVSKGKLLVQIREEMIEAEVYNSAGTLYVKESDTDVLAHQWLIKRVARLPQLADRVISYTSDEHSFVIPTGQLLDQIEFSPNDQPQYVEDAVKAARKVLDRRPAGTSSILYLTSDAGEGKTTLINQMARTQAYAYKNKETDWLMIPITLGGRPFLRFDDVVIGALVNRFRFQFFYYDAFLELVRLGVLVPAFDGFEEMFIESSTGEALSALGNLLNALESSGSVLISARKAYFEYKNFEAQAKLFDAIKSDSVAFSRLSLNRWNRNQFLTYCNKRGVADGEQIYRDISERLTADHPLLTRAVLVRRLVDVAATLEGRELLLAQLGHAPHDYFYQFVEAILEREAQEKWIDRSGQPAQPLLTVGEHHDLLSFIAQEMWFSSTDILGDDVLELITDLFSEMRGKSANVSRQVKERIKQHALLVSINNNKVFFTFDHEEFRNFFLGEAIGRRLTEGNDSDLRNLLRVGRLPNQSFDSAVQFLRRTGYNLTSAITTLQTFSQTDSSTSFTRENCGGLIIRLLDGYDGQNRCSVRKVTFPPDAFRGRRIEGIRFSDCYFQSSTLDDATIRNCNFEQCRFDYLEFDSGARIENVSLASCEISSLTPAGQDVRIFAPETISRAIVNAGFTVTSTSGEAVVTQPPPQVSEEIQILDRALRCFLRSTQINEETIRVRLGVKANLFFDELLPELLRTNVLEEIPYGGQGKQRRFKLNVPMREINDAMAQSNGDYLRFISNFT